MSRNIVLSFAAGTPQVVTELLFCLHREFNVHKGELILLTTKPMIKHTASLKEKVQMFCQAYSSKGVDWQFSKDPAIDWTTLNKTLNGPESGVVVLPIDDINSQEKNETAANTLTRMVHYWCQDDVNLFLSLAGGRKQLVSYMYQAVMWFGRTDQHRLFHVIPGLGLELRDNKGKPIHPEGWRSSDGFFPDPGHPAEELISLVEQPYIGLHGLLSEFLEFSGTERFLDSEKPADPFPFLPHTPPAKKIYITYSNIVSRTEFYQYLLSKDNPKFNIELQYSESDQLHLDVSVRDGAYRKTVELTPVETIWLIFLYRLPALRHRYKEEYTTDAVFDDDSFSSDSFACGDYRALGRMLLEGRDRLFSLNSDSNKILGLNNNTYLWTLACFVDSADKMPEKYLEDQKIQYAPRKNSYIDEEMEEWINFVETTINDLKKLQALGKKELHQVMKAGIFSGNSTNKKLSISGKNLTGAISTLKTKLDDHFGKIDKLPFHINRTTGRGGKSWMTQCSYDFQIKLKDISLMDQRPAVAVTEPDA